MYLCLLSFHIFAVLSLYQTTVPNHSLKSNYRLSMITLGIILWPIVDVDLIYVDTRTLRAKFPDQVSKSPPVNFSPTFQISINRVEWPLNEWYESEWVRIYNGTLAHKKSFQLHYSTFITKIYSAKSTNKQNDHA